ncbi:DUF4190 domain-containing protein [Streptomyces sp. NPDC050738]|uniref:DUF4190 domain-containing protein n=1 Tax=Streptomyces sp. NPDC050738 TaxID=3154744 RepID=UPI0034224348
MDIPPQQPYYGPYAHPYAPHPPRPPAVNGAAVASLVLGVVCVAPPLGLILGIVALAQIRKRGGGGKGLAVAGIVLSSFSTVLALVMVIVLGPTAWNGFKEGVRSAGTASDLRKGDCFDVPGGVGNPGAGRARSVSCAGAHDGEVTGDFDLLDTGAYPGKEAIATQAEKRCWEANDAYAMDIWAVPDGAEMFYYPPSASSWRRGDHAVSCAYVIEDGAFHGSLRKDAGTLGDDQVAFLTSADSIDRVLWQGPEQSAAKDLPANRAWAREVASTLFNDGQGLKAYSWSARAKEPMAVLLRDIETSRQYWAKAAEAKDAAAFGQLTRAADTVLGPSLGLEVRRVLGLDLTPWAADPSDGSDGGEHSGSGGVSV